MLWPVSYHLQLFKSPFRHQKGLSQFNPGQQLSTTQLLLAPSPEHPGEKWKISFKTSCQIIFQYDELVRFDRSLLHTSCVTLCGTLLWDSFILDRICIQVLHSHKEYMLLQLHPFLFAYQLARRHRQGSMLCFKDFLPLTSLGSIKHL